METCMLLFGVATIIFILLFIAEPLRFIPEIERKNKRVGGTYWGQYEGTEDVPEDGLTVELKPVSRRQQYIAGSVTYSQGRGVNMSGRK